jgi:hypothetical protein
MSRKRTNGAEAPSRIRKRGINYSSFVLFVFIREGAEGAIRG